MDDQTQTTKGTSAVDRQLPEGTTLNMRGELVCAAHGFHRICQRGERLAWTDWTGGPICLPVPEPSGKGGFRQPWAAPGSSLRWICANCADECSDRFAPCQACGDYPTSQEPTDDKAKAAIDDVPAPPMPEGIPDGCTCSPVAGDGTNTTDPQCPWHGSWKDSPFGTDPIAPPVVERDDGEQLGNCDSIVHTQRMGSRPHGKTIACVRWRPIPQTPKGDEPEQLLCAASPSGKCDGWCEDRCKVCHRHIDSKGVGRCYKCPDHPRHVRVDSDSPSTVATRPSVRATDELVDSWIAFQRWGRHTELKLEDLLARLDSTLDSSDSDGDTADKRGEKNNDTAARSAWMQPRRMVGAGALCPDWSVRDAPAWADDITLVLSLRFEARRDDGEWWCDSKRNRSLLEVAAQRISPEGDPDKSGDGHAEGGM